MEDLAPFRVDGFDDAKCFQNLLLQYESKFGTQALETLQKNLSITSQELKSQIVSAVRTDFDALARAPLEMLRLDDCVQRIEDKAQSLQNMSASSLDKINVVKSEIDIALEEFQRCHSHRLRADAELQRVLWLHDLAAALSRNDFASQPGMDQDAADETAAGACLHLCMLAHAVSEVDNGGNECGGNNIEVEDAAAAAVVAVHEAVLPRIKDALHRLHRVPCYVRCLCLVAGKQLVISIISDAITCPILSKIFASAASSRDPSSAITQLFVDLETELCQLLQLLQRSRLLLSGDQEIDAGVELLLAPFFARLLKSEWCTDFVQVDTVADRYFSYMKGLQLLANSSACNDSDDMRSFLLHQHEASSSSWALPLRALSQSRLSRIQSVLTPRLTGAGPPEPSSLAPVIEEAAAAAGVRTPAAAAAAWAFGIALPSVQQPPPLLPRAMQLICVVLANLCSWFKALADAATSPLESGTTPRSAPPPLSLLLQASADCSAVAVAASKSVQTHSLNLTAAIIDSALAPCLAPLSASGRNLYAAAAKLASAQLSEMMVSVRSIAISFRQSSRPYPTSASAYVELQQQLLQRFSDDIKTSGLSLNEQHEWLREVCEAAAGEWATCVDDILTTARRQDTFARKSRERAGGDTAAPAAGTGVSDALPKMVQQVRLDVEEVCRGWAAMGMDADNLAGVVKLRACAAHDSL